MPVWEAWPAVAARLPADLDLDQLARDTGALRRCRDTGIADGASLLMVALARGPGGKSLQDTAAWARLNGVAELCGQSLNERLCRSVGFLAGVLHRLLLARPPAKPWLWAGRCLRIADASSLSRPGSKGTDWRLHGVYDLQRGGFAHLAITDRHGAESLLRAEPVAGEVAIGDRGYAKAKALLACLDTMGAQGRDFIVRIGWKALALQDPGGEPFSLIDQLARLPADALAAEWQVRVMPSARTTAPGRPLRLIAVPLPPEQVEKARQKLRRKASKHQDQIDRRSLLAAGFLVLATSLPATIPGHEIAAAYRLRWQIELAFKRLKSLLHIDQLPTRTPAASLAWLYAHLIALVLSEDLTDEILALSP